MGWTPSLPVTEKNASFSLAHCDAVKVEEKSIPLLWVLGSMTLSWTAPTQNDDGAAPTDLAGFILYFGNWPDNHTKQAGMDYPSISTYLIENLLPDTYYVVATAFNSAGVESRYSGEAVKSVTILQVS